jgi:all-trans-retinol 13,14-reductase
MTEPDLSFKRARARGDLDHDFDTIVIGSGAGGLTTAALLALTGQRVLVLERHAVLGGCLQSFERQGFEWDVGLHYIGEVHRPSSWLYRLFDKVTRGQMQWAPMPEVYNRVVIDGRSYDHVAGAEAYKQRLKDYFPDEAPAIDRYVELVQQATRAAKAFYAERALPSSVPEALAAQARGPMQPFVERTVLQVMDELTDNAELKTVWCANYGDYCNSPAEASFAVHALVLHHYLEGASYPVGGAPRIASAMAETVRQAGGACLVGAEVSRLALHDGQVVGVETADGTRLHGRRVVSAIGIDQTLPLLAQADPGLVEPLAAQSAGLGTTQCFTVLNVGLDAANGELGMHPGNLWLHPSNDIRRNLAQYHADPWKQPLPLCFITHPSQRDPSWNERRPGRSTMDVCGLTDWSLFERFAGTGWMRRGAEYEDLKARMTQSLLDLALQHFPQIRGRIAIAELATPLTFNHFLNRSRGNFMGYEQTPRRFAQRWMRAIAPVKGLYFSGQDVTSAGVSGAMLGGLVAASAVLGRDLFQELKPREPSLA